MKKNIISLGFTILFIAFYYYMVLPPLNVQALGFWIFIIFIIMFYLIINSFSSLIDNSEKITHFLKYGNSKPYKTIEEIKVDKVESIISKILGSSILIIVFLIMAINIFNSPIFNADSFANRISIDEDNDFITDIPEVDFNSLPLLDKESTQKLGDRKMGEKPDWVSQYSVSSLYTQINYGGEILRVTPLEYADFFKYLSNKNEGVKGYITVNSVDGNAEIHELENGMKIMPSAFFGEDLMRTLRFSYPTEIFGEASFEIDEDGNPYWIVPTIDYAGISMRAEIDGVIILDAVTGDSKKYAVEDVPKWVDHVYSSSLIIEQIDNWGDYVNGFWNSIFGQKNVVNTTDGYNYITINDDVYLYTGITSVAADESNLGFVLVNLRTKEANYYPAAGAEEYSAMNSAQGLVQEKNYIASFPLLINLNDRPTYLLSLKDAAGLVKMYAFVDVEDYQIVSTTDVSLGIDKAALEYLSKINTEVSQSGDVLEKSITIKTITSGIIDGNTIYFLTDSENNKYQLSIKVDESVTPFLKVGDILEITYTEDTVNNIKTIN